MYNNRMPSAPSSATVVCTDARLAAVDADILLFPWFEDEALPAVGGLDAATGGEVARALGSREFEARRYDMFLAPVTSGEWRTCPISTP